MFSNSDASLLATEHIGFEYLNPWLPVIINAITIASPLLIIWALWVTITIAIKSH